MLVGCMEHMNQSLGNLDLLLLKQYWDVCNYLKNVDKSSYKHAQQLIYNVFAIYKSDGLN